MADGWFAPLPRCLMHGQMHHNASFGYWTCPGWDGEGCDYYVLDQNLDWRPLGTLENLKLDAKWLT